MGRPLRVALYTRVSTEDQAQEGFSLDAQLDRLRSHAKAQQWQVAGEYVEEGQSGRRTRRPQYQAMMQEMDKWDVVLVLKMDRIHRNIRNFIEMMDMLGSRGKAFASVQDSLDTTTAMGRFVMFIVQLIAQLESEQTGERVQIGLHQKARTTTGALCPPSFGMQVRDGIYVGNPRELRIVEMIFERYLADYSLHDIAAALNNQGMHGRRGAPWRETTVRNALRNAALIGIRIWGGLILAGDHEPLIDAQTFAKAQEKLDQQGIVISSPSKGPDFAIKRAEAIRATLEGRPYHAEFKPNPR